LNRARNDIEAAAGRLVLIGQATPRHAAHYKRRYAPELQILADEERGSYRAAGTIRGGAAELLSPGVILKGIGRSAKNRQVQGRPVGDVQQLGGTMIVMPDGSIPWSHMSTDAADNATVEEIVEALTRVT
jgi:hypothetical protein